MKKSELQSLIREELKRETMLRESALKGGVIGYLAGVLADFLLSKKSTAVKHTEKSADQLKKEMQVKLEKKYNTDPKFKELVDAIQAGQMTV